MPRLFPFVGPTFIYKPKKNYQTVLAITCATAECAVYDSLPVKNQCIVLKIVSLCIIFAAIKSTSKEYLKTLVFSIFSLKARVFEVRNKPNPPDLKKF